ncbi:AsmA-like C-terminal region-containing protein [Gaetbulibacter sp. M240]|uniref:AsmA-like C-terminal region-containing protein n=1 Tax=Gaetbulibacter sp. M240 TaxID=3126511 RepID=UPI00374EEE0B
MKKFLKILGLSVLIIFALLLILPYAFSGKINTYLENTINENLNAKVSFSDVSLSFIRNFPNAHVGIHDLKVTNLAPFEGETLATAKTIGFTLSIKQLFKDLEKEPIVIDKFSIEEALLTLKSDTFGNTNYDITKTDSTAVAEDEPSNLKFSLEDYSIYKSAVTYEDEASQIKLDITELNHSGHGIFSANTSELDTKTDANLSLSLEGTNYLSSNPVKLDALIGLDLPNSKYTFKENKGFINQLPIAFDGYVQLIEGGQDIDIRFENPESDFKNFLAVIPEAYSKNIENVETTGDFKVKGIIKGLVTDTTIPTLDISIKSNNASFKYPELPKRVTNITIDTEIKNTTGKTEDTYVAIKALNFNIDEDSFRSSATLKNLMGNMQVDAYVDGVLNLAKISQVYPLDLKEKLSGILKANVNTSFDMNAIETNAYERIKNSGTASITNFNYSSPEMLHPVQIASANVQFNSGTVTLKNFNAKTGESDINATGTIKNLTGFLLSDNTLQGNFNLISKVLKVNDFMSEDTPEESDEKASENLKIPAFLDCTITAMAETVVYDNLNLKDVSGTLTIKDQTATLKDLKSSIFDGALTVSGAVSTQEDTPTFKLNLNASGFDIGKSFKGLELLQNIAPLAKLLQGKLNSDLNISGDLTKDFTPNLNSVSGNALAELLSTKLTTTENPLISSLGSSLRFIDFNKLNLNDLKTKVSFANGKVQVKPFDFKYDDIAITVSGSHGFDKTMDYSAVFNVPAKYLGSDVNRLIGKIDAQEANTLSIPITAKIGGTFSNPEVKTDLSSGVSNLTKQLIEIEKQKALNTGKDKVKSMLGNLIGTNQTKSDSLKQEQSNSVKTVLGDLVGSKDTETDSTKTGTTKETVKNVLGGLLGKKKKVQDTVK